MNKEKLQNVILIVVVVLLALAAGYFLREGVGEIGDPEEELEETSVELIRDSHFFRAGTDGELGARNEGEAVTVFNPGDYLGISGEYDVEETTRMTNNLLDENEVVISEGFLPSFTAHETDGSSGFSVCCAGVPNREGEYYVELIVDDQRVELLSFEVEE